MINADFRQYSYFTFGDLDEYGQEVLSTEPKGTVKISINSLSQSIADNIKYKESTYLGLTHSKLINDSWVIDYDGVKLKVLYVMPKGRFKQVFFKEI